MPSATYLLVGHLKAEQPLATCSMDLMERERGGNTRPVPVPHVTTAEGERLMFPATGIRGRLRRMARDVVRNEVIAQGGGDKPFSLEEHYFLTLGGIKGKGEEAQCSVAEQAAWRAKNPLLSLFGAGDAGLLGFVQGRLSVGNAVCRDVSEPTIFSGARSNDLYRDHDQTEFLSDEDIQRLVSQAQGTRDRTVVKGDIKTLEAAIRKARKAGDTDSLEALIAEKAELEAQMESIKDASGTTDNSVGMPLAGWKAIPEGAVMDHRMILARTTEIELGLVIKMLAQWAQLPTVGAHYAQGCGLMSGQWDVYEITPDAKQPLGTITMTPFEPLQITNGDRLHAARQAFSAFMATPESWNFTIPAKAK